MKLQLNKEIGVWVLASDELPENSKTVFAKDKGGIKYAAFYTKANMFEVEFEDDDDLPDYVDSNAEQGRLTLKEGWYEECENTGYYDLMIYSRDIIEWLKPVKEVYVLTPDELEKISVGFARLFRNDTFWDLVKEQDPHAKTNRTFYSMEDLFEQFIKYYNK